MKARELLIKITRLVARVLFFVFTLIIYLAYYQGLIVFTDGAIGNFILIPVLSLTYMFRQDVLASAFAFYGAWKGWGFPMWQALVVSGAFVGLSMFVNETSSAVSTIAERVAKPERPIDVVQEDKKDKALNESAKS